MEIFYQVNYVNLVMQCTQQHFLQSNYTLLMSYYASKLIKHHFLKTKLQIFEAKSDIRGGRIPKVYSTVSEGTE